MANHASKLIEFSEISFCVSGEKGDAGIDGRDGGPGPQGEKGNDFAFVE